MLTRSTILTLLLSIVAAGSVFAGGSPEHDTTGATDIATQGSNLQTDPMPVIDSVNLATGAKLRVVATTSIIGDVLDNIAGTTADVFTLMPVGQDPHAYEPTPSAMRSVADADIVLVNGFDLEQGLLRTIRADTKAYVVPVSAGIRPRAFAGEDSEHDAGPARDPHVWMDPNLAQVWVRNIVSALSAADPAHASIYSTNGSRYAQQLAAIDVEMRTNLDAIPTDRRKLLVDHDAFGYLADEYGLQVVGAIIPSFSDTAEPSAQEVAGLVRVVREQDVHAIFVGTSASAGIRKLADSIAKESGRQVLVLPTLTGSLAPKGEPGDTYLGFLRYNMSQIITGL